MLDRLAERRVPHNIEAEQALLGAILIDNGAIDRLGSLEPGDFVKQRGVPVGAVFESDQFGSGNALLHGLGILALQLGVFCLSGENRLLVGCPFGFEVGSAAGEIFLSRSEMLFQGRGIHFSHLLPLEGFPAGWVCLQKRQLGEFLPGLLLLAAEFIVSGEGLLQSFDAFRRRLGRGIGFEIGEISFIKISGGVGETLGALLGCQCCGRGVIIDHVIPSGFVGFAACLA